MAGVVLVDGRGKGLRGGANATGRNIQHTTGRRDGSAYPSHRIRSKPMKRMLDALRTGKVAVLALIVALTLGAASTAMGHGGFAELFHRNHSNAVNAVSTFVGSVAGPILRLDNNNANGSALNLQVEPNQPPLTVNSTAGKATNLNADRLDGKGAPEL